MNGLQAPGPTIQSLIFRLQTKSSFTNQDSATWKLSESNKQ